MSNVLCSDFIAPNQYQGFHQKKFQITYKSCSILYTFFQSSKMKLAVENILG